jgi:hypothetical protein
VTMMWCCIEEKTCDSARSFCYNAFCCHMFCCCCPKRKRETNQEQTQMDVFGITP